jgi:hypothetical protein
MRNTTVCMIIARRIRCNIVSVMALQREVDKWRGLATMMSHFDICTSARFECNICAEARQAYVEALSQ